MAKAEKVNRPPVPMPYDVRLTLSATEAEALQALLGAQYGENGCYAIFCALADALEQD